jgi:hypothetical protein
VSIGVGMLAAPSAGFIGLVAGVLGVMAVLAARCAAVRRLVSELGRGLAVLRDPRRFATCVAPWQVAGRALRMAACGASCTPRACRGRRDGPRGVRRPGVGQCDPDPGRRAWPRRRPACSSRSRSRPARPLDPAAVTTLAVLMPAALTAVGVTLSLALLSSIVGLRTPRSLFATARALSPRAADATP